MASKPFLPLILAALGGGLIVLQTEDEPGEGWRSVGEGVVRGDLVIDPDLAAALALAGVPDLRVHAGKNTSRPIDSDGAFVVHGLPDDEVELRVLIGGEVLTRVTGVPTDAPDPRLDGLVLDAPVRTFEFDVAEGDGPVRAGWLAWRPSGFDVFEHVVPIHDGRAVVVSLSDAVDVLPLVAGRRGEERAGLTAGESLEVVRGAVVVAPLPIGVPRDVVLRLEVEPAAGAGASEVRGGRMDGDLAGDAARRSIEMHAVFALPDEDTGVPPSTVRLPLRIAGPAVARWRAMLQVGEHVTGLRAYDGTAVSFEAPLSGECAVTIPLDLESLEAAASAARRREGVGRR